MNWVTILVLVIWGLTAFWGYRTGLIRMVVPLVVVLVGLALSSRMAEPVGNLFSFLSENENVQTVAAFITIFVVLFVVAAWLSSFLRTAIGVVPLAGMANSLAGAAVGILIGFVILAGILTGLQKFPVGNFREDIDDSRLGQFLADNFDVVIRGTRLIPGDWDQKAQDFTDGIRGKFDDIKDHLHEVDPNPLSARPTTLPDVPPTGARWGPSPRLRVDVRPRTQFRHQSLEGEISGDHWLQKGWR